MMIIIRLIITIIIVIIIIITVIRMGLAGYDPAEEDMRGIFMAKGPGETNCAVRGICWMDPLKQVTTNFGVLS